MASCCFTVFCFNIIGLFPFVPHPSFGQVSAPCTACFLPVEFQWSAGFENKGLWAKLEQLSLARSLQNFNRLLLYNLKKKNLFVEIVLRAHPPF